MQGGRAHRAGDEDALRGELLGRDPDRVLALVSQEAHACKGDVRTLPEMRMPSAMSSLGVTQTASQPFSRRRGPARCRRPTSCFSGRIKMTRPGGYMSRSFRRRSTLL